MRAAIRMEGSQSNYSSTTSRSPWMRGMSQKKHWRWHFQTRQYCISGYGRKRRINWNTWLSHQAELCSMIYRSWKCSRIRWMRSSRNTCWCWYRFTFFHMKTGFQSIMLTARGLQTWNPNINGYCKGLTIWKNRDLSEHLTNGRS